MMRKLLNLAAMAAFLALAPAAMAQGNAPIDKAYESSKTAELESVKLQLATSSSPTALAELTEADSALRRLKEAKAPDLRRKIATELESALTRLRLEADSAGLKK
jgi:hypothetical protein